MKLIYNLSIGSLRLLSAVGSTLLNGLVSYWPLNEISGTRADAVGDNDLTDNNTVGAALRGPEGTVAYSLKANSESLTATVAMPTTYSVMTWVHQPADIIDQYGSVVALKNSVLCDLSYGNLRSSYGATHFVNLAMFDGAWRGTGAHFPTSVGTPHMLVGTCDNTAKEIKVYANGVQQGTTATFVNTAGDYGTTDTVSLGANGAQFSQVYSANWSIRQGPTAVWSRILTAQEQTDLLALGNGLRYADLPAGLLTGLVSWWELDEVSGVRYDSHGSNDLTDNNTVGSVNSGPKGVVADIASASSENLTKASFVMPNSYMVAGWYKADKADNPIFLCANYYTNYNHQVAIHHNNPNTIIHSVGNGADSIVYTGTFTPGAPSIVGDGLWHFIEAWFDYSEKMPHIRIDRGPTDVWTTTGPLTGTPYRGAETLSIGGGTAGYQYVDGQVARFGLWSGVDLSRLDELWNGGPGGVSYSQLSDAAKVGLVSYWNLDEASGVRYDSHGTNHLTDNNTVGSVINAGAAMDGAAASFVKANSEYLKSTTDYPADTSLTVSLWFKPSSVAAVSELFSLGTGGVFIMRANTPYYQLVARGYADAPYFTGGVDFVVGNWYHCIGWYDADAGEYGLALNGVAHTFAAGGALGAGTDLSIGSRGDGSESTDGIIDEVAIWSRVLTADERAELYALGRGKYYDFS